MKCEQIEVLLSGYLDRELVQQQAQQVEIHLARCRDCRMVLDELKTAQRAASQLKLREPSGEEWRIMESRIMAKISRSIGWLILLVWSTVTVAYALYQYATSPTETLFHKILVFGFFLGLALVFISVLLERMRDSRNDRYKGVLK
jgi:hypothetical protein